MVTLLRYILFLTVVVKLVSSLISDANNSNLIKYNLIGRSNFSNFIEQNELEPPTRERRFYINGIEDKIATPKSDHHQYSYTNQHPFAIQAATIDDTNVFGLRTPSGFGTNHNRLAPNGYSVSLHDPIFLLATLSFVAYLINTVLGLVNRVHVPNVYHARLHDQNELMNSIEQFLGEYYNLNDNRTTVF